MTKGYYCPAGTGNAREFACPGGYYSSATGAVDISTCTICPPGTFCQGGNSDYSNVCPAPYYCPNGTTDPLPCPGGTHGKGQVGKTNYTECSVCPAGYYCKPGSATPTPCPEGTYNPVEGRSDVWQCVLCDVRNVLFSDVLTC